MDTTTKPSSPRAAAQQPVDGAPRPPAPAVRAGLIPLPTPAQVEGAVPRGRQDPFAALPRPPKPAATPPAMAASAGSGAAPGAAPSLSLRGVLAVGGQLQALVSTATGSGAVCLGSRGRCLAEAEPLLPAGWTVQAIDLRRGCLTYSVGGKAQPPVCMT
ncbi:hypothetical protein SynRS9909_02532 [Synechococcus sp. RS9909]|nr:hypothetical protein SynRS9909_02532 [Synechococcus sp. RS9909]